MSVKTLTSWSVHAHSTHPGNPSGPVALLTSVVESVITQSYRQLVLSCMFQCYLPQSEHISSLTRLVGSCHWAALGCAFLCICECTHEVASSS